MRLTRAMGWLAALACGGAAMMIGNGPLTHQQSGLAKAYAGTAVVGGRRMSCRPARVVLSRSTPHVGAARRGVITLNPRLLNRLPSVTRRIIFLHECAHQYVGANETAADCWAVRVGVRQGWLSERGVRQVCRAFAGSRGTGAHLPGPARCRAMLSCYRNAKGRRSRARRASR